MAKRAAISRKLRFEVFKRDSFTCQYCGRKAPDILLQLDHIEPVAKGGLLNLITSCKDCNLGKSDRQLSDTTIIDKRRQQLEELQERKEQIEMMFQWEKEAAQPRGSRNRQTIAVLV
jgi:5-methylcytosine-specific restriction endonuclease McrA